MRANVVFLDFLQPLLPKNDRAVLAAALAATPTSMP